MRIQRRKYQYKENVKDIAVILLLFVLIFAGAGCASTHKTTKTETTVTYPNDAVGDEREQNRGVVEKSETTTATTTETKAGHPGIISSTVHAVGYVISLPFIFVGHLLRAIF